MHYIILFVILLAVLYAIKNFIEELFSSLENFFTNSAVIALLTAIISGLVHLIFQDDTSKKVAVIAIIASVVSFALYLLYSSLTTYRLKRIKEDIQKYVSSLPCEMDYTSLRNNMITRWGKKEFKINKETIIKSDDIIEENLKVYVDRNIDIIRRSSEDWLDDVLALRGAMDENEFLPKKRKLVRSYERYCTGDRVLPAMA